MTAGRGANTGKKRLAHEIETLEAHELMYKRRLKEKESTGGLTLRELTRIANSPKTYRKHIPRR